MAALLDDVYSDLDTDSDTQSMIRIPSNSDTKEEFYEVPLPALEAPDVDPFHHSYLPTRYGPEFYLSSSMSHRSKRHIRDSREYETMRRPVRSMLEVRVTP